MTIGALIVELSFTHAAGTPYHFVPNHRQRVTNFSASAPPRGESRPRMAMHGRQPRRSLFDGLEINHEGLIRDYTGGGRPEILTEREKMISLIQGDLTAPFTATALGTLRLKLSHWAEAGEALVVVESFERPLDVTVVRTAPYQIQWSAETPYFVGVDSSDPLYT